MNLLTTLPVPATEKPEPRGQDVRPGGDVPPLPVPDPDPLRYYVVDGSHV